MLGRSPAACSSPSPGGTGVPDPRQEVGVGEGEAGALHTQPCQLHVLAKQEPGALSSTSSPFSSQCLDLRSLLGLRGSWLRGGRCRGWGGVQGGEKLLMPQRGACQTAPLMTLLPRDLSALLAIKGNPDGVWCSPHPPPNPPC